MIQEFIDLYKKSFPIEKLKNKETDEYKLFSLKQGRPVRVVSTKAHLDYLPLVEGYFSFFREHKAFYIVPCETIEGRIYGFVLRGVQSKGYRIVIEDCLPQLTFGWETFKDFKKGDPIVVTEGAKDALYVKRFYPFTLTTLTSTVSKEIQILLSCLTNKLIVAFDNDYLKEKNSGQNSSKRLRRSLCDLGVSSLNLVPVEGFKDFGEYIKNPDMDNVFNSYLKNSINQLL